MVRFTKRYKYSRMNGGKKRRRKTIRKQKRRKHTKNQKRRRKRRKTKRRMKGGSGKGLLASPACSGFNCDLPQNAGAIFTKYSNNNNPFFPDPMSLNRNVRNPISPKPVGGKKGGRRKRKGRKKMKGGFFWDDWGLGDGLLSYYKGTNAALNTKHLYAGNKPEMSATPTHQPELLKKPYVGKTTANIPNYYEAGSTKAASYTVS